MSRFYQQKSEHVIPLGTYSSNGAQCKAIANYYAQDLSDYLTLDKVNTDSSSTYDVYYSINNSPIFIRFYNSSQNFYFAYGVKSGNSYYQAASTFASYASSSSYISNLYCVVSGIEELGQLNFKFIIKNSHSSSDVYSVAISTTYAFAENLNKVIYFMKHFTKASYESSDISNIFADLEPYFWYEGLTTAATAMSLRSVVNDYALWHPGYPEYNYQLLHCALYGYRTSTPVLYTGLLHWGSLSNTSGYYIQILYNSNQVYAADAKTTYEISGTQILATSTPLITLSAIAD